VLFSRSIYVKSIVVILFPSRTFYYVFYDTWSYDYVVVATTRQNGTCDMLTSAKLSVGYLVVGIYKRTRQGALAVLPLYLYKLHVVHATTVLTGPYVHTLFSCPITHPHVFSLRLPCFLYVPWHHTLNLRCICAHHVYTMRNPCLLTSSLILTPTLDSFQSF